MPAAVGPHVDRLGTTDDQHDGHGNTKEPQAARKHTEGVAPTEALYQAVVENREEHAGGGVTEPGEHDRETPAPDKPSWGEGPG